MNKTLALFAAAATLIVAGTSLAPVAEAGGMRLHFGYPLGSFVARPCGSCGGSYGHHESYDYRAAQRRAAARAEARREAIEEARREKAAEARREAIAEARREKAAEARREAIEEARREKAAEARREARLRKERDEKKVAKADAETPASVVAAPAAQPEVTVGEPKVIVNDKAADKPVEKTADKPADKATNRVAVAPDAPVAAPATTPAAAKPAPATVINKADAPAKPLDCKKFVPSAGLTITVPCQ